MDNCESNESSDDDYIELPAVTKHCDDIPLKPSNNNINNNNGINNNNNNFESDNST